MGENPFSRHARDYKSSSVSVLHWRKKIVWVAFSIHLFLFERSAFTFRTIVTLKHCVYRFSLV